MSSNDELEAILTDCVAALVAAQRAYEEARKSTPMPEIVGSYAGWKNLLDTHVRLRDFILKHEPNSLTLTKVLETIQMAQQNMAQFT